MLCGGGLVGINPDYMPEVPYTGKEYEGLLEKVRTPAYIKDENGNKIVNIVIPSTLEMSKIGSEAFSTLLSPDGPGHIDLVDVSEIESIVIPETVTDIGDRAFSYCIRLKSITIPSAVTTIKEYTFYRCEALETVYYSGTQAQWNAMTIEEGNEQLQKATIICSDGTIQPQQ